MRGPGQGAGDGGPRAWGRAGLGHFLPLDWTWGTQAPHGSELLWRQM